MTNEERLEALCRDLLRPEYGDPPAFALIHSKSLDRSTLHTVKYHPVQPRHGGKWVLPSGEHHPLNGGLLNVASSDHFADVRFTTYKTFDVGGGVSVAMPDKQAAATAYKNNADGELMLLSLAVDPGLQKKGIGSAMLAELGGMAKGAAWKYGTTSISTERGKQFMQGMQRRGFASPRENSSAAWWLDADKLSAKYARTEVASA